MRQAGRIQAKTKLMEGVGKEMRDGYLECLRTNPSANPAAVCSEPEGVQTSCRVVQEVVT